MAAVASSGGAPPSPASASPSQQLRSDEGPGGGGHGAAAAPQYAVRPTELTPASSGDGTADGSRGASAGRLGTSCDTSPDSSKSITAWDVTPQMRAAGGAHARVRVVAAADKGWSGARRVDSPLGGGKPPSPMSAAQRSNVADFDGTPMSSELNSEDEGRGTFLGLGRGALYPFSPVAQTTRFSWRPKEAGVVEGAYSVRFEEPWWALQVAALVVALVSDALLLSVFTDPDFASELWPHNGEWATATPYAVSVACSIVAALTAILAIVFVVRAHRLVMRHQLHKFIPGGRIDTGGLHIVPTTRRDEAASAAAARKQQSTACKPQGNGPVLPLESTAERFAEEKDPQSPRSIDFSVSELDELFKKARTSFFRSRALATAALISTMLLRGAVLPLALCEGDLEFLKESAFPVCRAIGVQTMPGDTHIVLGLLPFVFVTVFRFRRSNSLAIVAGGVLTLIGLAVTGSRAGVEFYSVMYVRIMIGLCATVVVSRTLQSGNRTLFGFLLRSEEENRMKKAATQEMWAEREKFVRADVSNILVKSTVGYASHELRNPLHAARNLLSEVMTAVGNEQSYRTQQDLSDLDMTLEHIEYVVTHIMDLASLEHGGMESVARPTDIRSLLRSITVSSGRRIRFDGTTGTRPLPARIKIDDTRVRQIVEGAVTHAVRTFPQTNIVISASSSSRPPAEGAVSRDGGIRPARSYAAAAGGAGERPAGGTIRIEVRSVGPGLRGAQVTSLFTPFGRYESLQNDVSSRVRGNGIGLSVCAKLVKLLGGTFGLYDDGPADDADEGLFVVPESDAGSQFVPMWTVFWMDLPYEDYLTAAGPGQMLSHSSSSMSETPGERERAAEEDVDAPLNCHVVFVEDEAVLRRIMKRILDKLGCTYVALSDGDRLNVDEFAKMYENPQASVSAKFGGKRADIILLDIVMPMMGGDVLCQRLRKRGIDIPIIATTGNTEDAAKLAEYGFSGVVRKPFTAASLRAKMIDCLASPAPPAASPMPRDAAVSPAWRPRPPVASAPTAAGGAGRGPAVGRARLSYGDDAAANDFKT